MKLSAIGTRPLLQASSALVIPRAYPGDCEPAVVPSALVRAIRLCGRDLDRPGNPRLFGAAGVRCQADCREQQLTACFHFHMRSRS
jgi:hypothetical protein